MRKTVKKIIALACVAVLAGSIMSFSACNQTKVISAYDIAVKNGFEGDEQAWLLSLQGANGKDGQSLNINDMYEAAKADGYTGTLLDFMKELGVDFRCVTIGDAVNQHFEDIGHDPNVRDITYENSQARERTQVLMDLANECGGMVVGTGDLSELALGWATYNGDHMSMYGVNANLPKTLIRHVVAYCADQADLQGQEKLAVSLRDILDTPVSPELLPADGKGQIAQKTEDLVGPYELHDFYLYHLLSNGYSPEKLYRLAKKAFKDTYSDRVLLKWLEVFLRRFFNQQFKRSCLPDGPAVFPISLSPRGGLSMPSDASSAIWLEEVRELMTHI